MQTSLRCVALRGNLRGIGAPSWRNIEASEHLGALGEHLGTLGEHLGTLGEHLDSARHQDAHVAEIRVRDLSEIWARYERNISEI